MYNISRCIKQIVESLKVNIKGKTVNVLNGLVTIETCDTKHININRVLILNNDIEVTVVSFIENTSFTFRLPSNFNIETLSSIEVKPFSFFEGTAKLTNTELDSIKDCNKKIPLVWLYAVFNEDETRNLSRPFEVSADLRLFILDQSNFQDWLYSDHKDKVLIPLRSYKESLIKAIQKNSEVLEIGNTRLTEHANWGRFVERGHIDKIFTDELSGLEIRLNIKMNYDINCKC